MLAMASALDDATPEERDKQEDGGSAAGSSGNVSFGGEGAADDGGTSSCHRDEDDFFGHRTFLQRARDLAFSLLFLMAHGNKSSHLFEYAGILVEDLQLYTFFLGKEVHGRVDVLYVALKAATVLVFKFLPTGWYPFKLIFASLASLSIVGQMSNFSPER
ncbi:hypothetical protein HK405_010832 [Cladochytrium tenue]|nr:hypothetical protein HK405_010832 [Cladochytrium tenue]